MFPWNCALYVLCAAIMCSCFGCMVHVDKHGEKLIEDPAYLPCSNHSWVSFQGFAEAYNDTFQLSKELGKQTLNNQGHT